MSALSQIFKVSEGFVPVGDPYKRGISQVIIYSHAPDFTLPVQYTQLHTQTEGGNSVSLLIGISGLEFSRMLILQGAPTQVRSSSTSSASQL
mmetsp:Transcript_20315/g.29805  ORF Transcript_20315/g.29805 Transcript_20315/m.29805 type:complete len:92 (-) Transcript_20315:406-681(-)